MAERTGPPVGARWAGPERVSLFSDAVFAVIMTILVLELKPPSADTFGALLPLWPTFLSYAVSYLFIAIVWRNHHHLSVSPSRSAPNGSRRAGWPRRR